ncbi:hypothetical protein FKG94_08835 [Exilibacterium tricleocarpae]|uniref:GyrI-like small molecule binding domain-containing protein n=1 Tax=Exilibacterium tricleocarpae TaxID=2591008 RepID=A0A545TVM0_9GAMM|nr:GyrI-like domain-containing protein [Exilibacterium tricleocarpae]TQV81201.1 hypothetical protein FKG94_08835 [Exilibacterium tricleocarpae]
MSKIDYKKELKELYRPSAKQVVEVHVPAMNFLMVDGKGEPGSKDYTDAVAALFSVAYTLKFMIKQGEQAIDYGVLPLEGLWWAEDMSDFVKGNKSNWIWKLMIMQPELITDKLVQTAASQVAEKKDLPALEKVRFESFSEGRAAQTLHVGPFSQEGPTVERVHEFIRESGAELAGKHHEIYLTDIRRAAPENWKTVIRQPMC